MHEVKRLYRRVNTRALNPNITRGGQYKHGRHSKFMKEFEGSHLSMQGHKQRGVDYTPLYRFLLSKVGQKWDDVYSEAVSRLDKKDPIFWMVDLHAKEGDRGYVRTGDSSYHSKLTVDEHGILVKVDPNFTKEMLKPLCTCCTYTFNGEVYK